MSAKKLKSEDYYKKLLYEITDFEFCCYKCNSEKFYDGKDFVKICKKCKTKTFVTRNTIFHNIRFGLVKAFEIAKEYYKSDYTLSSISVAKKYGITQKTAWKFLHKVNMNTHFIEELFNPVLNKNKKDYEKLKNYLN